jgi:hypothetical protein
MSDYPTRLAGRDDVMIVQPHECDEVAYWGEIDENPNAVVHLMILGGIDRTGDEWISSVFSTRAKAEAFIIDREIGPCMLDALIIDHPDYGNRMDA